VAVRAMKANDEEKVKMQNRRIIKHKRETED
jgi:hypothetical protein